MKINSKNKAEIIVITGPESSGKTTLAKKLNTIYGIPLVLEFARLYLEQNGSNYDFSDLEKIAYCQNIQEKEKHDSFPLIICDTDFITIDIWANEKFGKGLTTKLPFPTKKHYLLCKPDIPWKPDPLRENPNDRERLFVKYEEYLKQEGLSYEVLDESDRENL